MIFQNLVTGSSGNASLLKYKDTTILIDTGMTYTALKKRIDLKEIDAILITHMHSDHISGLKVIAKHVDCPIYIPRGAQVSDKLSHIDFSFYNKKFVFKDIVIHPFLLSHDILTCGFLFICGNSELVYITDTGFIPRKYEMLLANKDAYYIEANHDPRMLIEGPYPYYLKQRVIGLYGHLSNEESARFIQKVIGEKTQKIILGHMSEHNNHPKLIEETFKNYLKEDYNLVEIAKEFEGSEVFKLDTQPIFLKNILKLYETKTIFPAKEDIFKALELTPVTKTKVVLLGQDPYYSEDRANGLSFSIKQGSKISRSLQNIFKELENDLGIKRENTDLSDWAQEGVLLLNRVLTVEEGFPNSHKGLGWEEYTENIIKKINEKRTHVVFILLGREAQRAEKLIDKKKHKILKVTHPAPPACYNGFFGSKIFSKTNDYLVKHHIKPINWN